MTEEIEPLGSMADDRNHKLADDDVERPAIDQKRRRRGNIGFFKPQ